MFQFTIYTLLSITTFIVFSIITKEENNNEVTKSIIRNKRKLILPLIILFIGVTKLTLLSSNIVLHLLLLSVFIGYLAFNTFTDELSMDLYIYPYYIMFLFGAIFTFYFYKFNISTFIVTFLFYIFLQEFVFSKMYASGDSHMFLVCGLFLNHNIDNIFGCELPIMIFMLHMTFSLFIFLVYNLVKKNITKILKLKEVAPFAFSIALGAILMI